MPYKNTRRSSSLDVHLDEGLRTRLDLLLWSEAERRVPKGAYQKFFNTLLARTLDSRSLDLSPPSAPGTCVVWGTEGAIENLRNLLSLAGGKK